MADTVRTAEAGKHFFHFFHDSNNNTFFSSHKVVNDDSPQLEPNKYSPNYENLITLCLKKSYTDRPNYEALLQHPFLVEHNAKQTNVAAFVEEILSLPESTSA